MTIKSFPISGTVQEATDTNLEGRIRQRAYDIYRERLENPTIQDWLQAELEVRSQLLGFKD